MGVKQ